MTEALSGVMFDAVGVRAALEGSAEGVGERVREPVAVLPVVDEELRVGKRVVETGRVRVTKRVHEREELVDEPLVREEYDVERVPVNVFVDEPVGPREGCPARLNARPRLSPAGTHSTKRTKGKI
jgi:hypothetical protein